MPLAGSDRGARSNAHFRHAERHMRDRTGGGASFGKAMAHFERAMAYGTADADPLEQRVARARAARERAAQEHRLARAHPNIRKCGRFSNSGPYALAWEYDDNRRKAVISVEDRSGQVARITLQLVQSTGGDWIFDSSVEWLQLTSDVQQRYIARAVASLVLRVQEITSDILAGRSKRIEAEFDATWIMSPLDASSAWQRTEHVPKKKSFLQRAVPNDENKENEGGNIGRAVLDTGVATLSGMLNRLRVINAGYNSLDDTQSDRPATAAKYDYYTNGGRHIYGVSVSATDWKSVHVTVIKVGERKADATIAIDLDVSTKKGNEGKLFVSGSSFTFSDSASTDPPKAYIRLAVASLLCHLHPSHVEGTFDKLRNTDDARTQWTHHPEPARNGKGLR